MFERQRVGLRVADIRHETMDKDEKEIGLVVMSLEINPFTVELCNEWDEYMRATLFTRSDAVVNTKLRSATFDLSELPQKVSIYMASDGGRATLVIAEAKVSPIRVSRSKLSTELKASFDIRFNPASKEQLAQAVDSRTKMRFFTFEDGNADLFSEIGKEEARARRAASAGEEETAAASTH